MSIIGTIVVGFLAGLIGKALMPGQDPGGFIVTILIGIVGSFIGHFVAGAFGFNIAKAFSIANILVSGLGAFALLFVYRKFVK